jgi:hypothetical protein
MSLLKLSYLTTAWRMHGSLELNSSEQKKTNSQLHLTQGREVLFFSAQ